MIEHSALRGSALLESCSIVTQRLAGFLAPLAADPDGIQDPGRSVKAIESAVLKSWSLCENFRSIAIDVAWKMMGPCSRSHWWAWVEM